MFVIDPTPATVLFALAVSVHNAEEAIWLPGFSRSVGIRVVDADGFRLAVLVFTLGLYGVCLAAVSGGGPLAVYALCGLGAAMGLNAFIPHLAATIRFRRYAPGTATALLLDLPAAVVLIASQLAARANRACC